MLCTTVANREKINNVKNKGVGMKHFWRIFFYSGIIPFCITPSSLSSAPRVAIIFVVDQFAHHYIQRTAPYLHGGIAHLLNNGVVYENAYYPHAAPSTGTGHTALNTGCFAKDHGIAGNKWFDAEGNMIVCISDTPKNAAVFDKNGKFLNIGKSAANIRVPGVSTQTILQARPGGNNQVVSLSYKDRAAITTAGPLGKAIWFDGDSGIFTTSKAYFKKFPLWVKEFNETMNLGKPRTITWDLAYPETASAYNTTHKGDYSFARHKKPFVKNTHSVPDKHDKKSLFQRMTMLPFANQLLLDLAFTCLENNLSENKNDKFVLWISLSPLDRVGPYFGPDSTELLDMIYHLDKQLEIFIKKVGSLVNKADTLFVLTADHGIAPIPELVKHIGIKTAQRIIQKKLIQELNQLAKTYRIENPVFKFKSPQFFLDEKKLNRLKKEKREKLINAMKQHLLKNKSIVIR